MVKNMNRSILLQELKRDEGFVSHVYKDHLGYDTIGVGRLVDRRRGGGISEYEGDILLGNDVDRVVGSLDHKIPWMRDLSDARQRALVNMAFQLGVNGLLNFRKTLSFMKDGKFEEAAEEALNSRWARQTPERAKRIAKMIREGE